jgi:bifunctional polynucleotide phosphatase/kinase
MEDPKPTKQLKNGVAAPQAETTLNWAWKMVGTLCVGSTENDTPASKIAMFDMDDNLIRVKSGAKFGKDSNDWVLWDDSVPKKLQEAKQQGFRVVIISNQGGIAKGTTSKETIQNKIQNFSKLFGIEMSAMFATDEDGYRKPFIGMWKYITSVLNVAVPVSVKESFMVGDAAGRPKRGEIKADFSDSDR